MGHASGRWSRNRQTARLAAGTETAYGPLVGGRLRVLSWNLWWRFGPWEDRLPAIVDTVKRLDPDIACLQEVWIDDERRDSSARRIADVLGAEHRGGHRLDRRGHRLRQRRRLAVADHRVRGARRSRPRRTPTSCGRACGPTSTRPTGRCRSSRTHLNWRFDQSGDPPGAGQGDLRVHPRRAATDVPADPVRRHERRAGQRRDPHAHRPGGGAGAEARLPRRLGGRRRRAPGLTWSNANPHAVRDLEPDRRIDYVLVGLAEGGRPRSGPRGRGRRHRAGRRRGPERPLRRRCHGRPVPPVTRASAGTVTDADRRSCWAPAGSPAGPGTPGSSPPSPRRRAGTPGRRRSSSGTSAGSITGAALRSGVSPRDLHAGAVGTALSAEGAALMGRVRTTGDFTRGRRAASPRPSNPSLVVRSLALLDPRPGVALAGLLPAGDGRHGDDLEPGRGARRRTDVAGRAAVGGGGAAARRGRVVFGRDDVAAGVGLGAAVAASSSIPGFFAPVEIAGARYVDGGVHSPTNADLVRDGGFDLVVVSAPMAGSWRSMRAHPRPSPGRAPGVALDREVAALRRSGTEVLVFQPGPADTPVMDGRRWTRRAASRSRPGPGSRPWRPSPARPPARVSPLRTNADLRSLRRRPGGSAHTDSCRAETVRVDGASCAEVSSPAGVVAQRRGPRRARGGRRAGRGGAGGPAPA